MKVETLERASEVVAQHVEFFVAAVQEPESRGMRMFPVDHINRSTWLRILGMVDVDYTRDTERLFPPLVRVAVAASKRNEEVLR